MSIEQTLAQIPSMTTVQRASLRLNAQSKLEAGAPQWLQDARRVLDALGEFEEQERRNADVARASKVAALEGSSVAERVLCAFEYDPPSQHEHSLIQTLLDNPGLSCSELSDRHGWREVAWDMQYGAMCSKRRDFLTSRGSVTRAEPARFIDLLTDEVRGEDGELRYSTKPVAVEAFKQLGFRVSEDAAEPKPSR